MCAKRNHLILKVQSMKKTTMIDKVKMTSDYKNAFGRAKFLRKKKRDME